MMIFYFPNFRTCCANLLTFSFFSSYLNQFYDFNTSPLFPKIQFSLICFSSSFPLPLFLFLFSSSSFPPHLPLFLFLFSYRFFYFFHGAIRQYILLIVYFPLIFSSFSLFPFFSPLYLPRNI